MAQYDFRPRFRLPRRDYINSEAEELPIFHDDGGAIVRLRSGARGTPIRDHSHAALIDGPYSSAARAQTAAERAKTALLSWAVRNRIGIDLGGRSPAGVITPAGQRLLEQEIGGPVRTDVQGVDVYEHVDGLTFVALGAEASLGKAAAALVEEFAGGMATPVSLSAKQELAAEILSASYFDNSDRSRFITLMTAVEALLEPQLRPPAAEQFVARMLQALKEAGLEEGTRAAMSGSLERLRRESIGQAGRAIADRLLGGKAYAGQPPGRFFSLCYNLRGSMLHLGKVSVEMNDLAGVCAAAQPFVCDLVVASLAEAAKNQRAAPPED